MGKYSGLLIAFLLSVSAGWTQTANSISVSGDGWMLTADAEQGVLSIAHDNLGTMMKDVRLNLQGEHGLLPLESWSVEKQGENQLFIRTVNPPTGWLFELGSNELKISSTVTECGSHRASAGSAGPSTRPSPGFPGSAGVIGRELGESLHHFGGQLTQNPSFLPTRNPECMYFALGQVSSSNLHSLFDRSTDTAISFPNQAQMRRNPQDADLLDLAIPVPGNALVRVLPDYFTKTLGAPRYVRFDDSYFRKAPAVWGSWPSYYGGITEKDMVQNADWLAAHLKPYGFDYVELDEGYDGGNKGRDFEGENHLWIGEWDPTTFPHGPQWLANHIKSEGLGAGLWLVPNAYAGAVQAHPDWYLRDKQGKFIPDYSTPSLDSTNPQVLEFLKKLFTTLDDWGFDYYKLDGEFSFPTYAPIVDRDRLYDRTIDPVTAYLNRVKLIGRSKRQTCAMRTLTPCAPSHSGLQSADAGEPQLFSHPGACWFQLCRKS